MRRNNVSATGDHHQQQQQHAEDDSNTNKKDERQGGGGGGGEAPQQQQQQQQKTRHFKQHSHGNIARSAHFHSHDDDEVDSAPPVILTNSPGTPPKKVWEKSYHKFLTLHRRGGAGGGSTTAGAAAAGDTNNNNTRTRHHHHHHQQQHSASSPSTLALTAAETCSTSSSNFSQHTSISQQQQQPQQALQQQQQQQSSLTPKGLMSRTIMTTSTRLAVKQQRQSGESTTLQHQDDSSAPPLSPSPPAAISVPGGTAVAFKEAHDSSVRGGNFFSQVFRSSSGGTTTSPSSQHSHGGSNKPHRKIKSIISVSSDELDGTLRRGAQKSSYCSSSSSNSHGGSHQTLAAISATAAAAAGTSFTRGEGSGSGSRGGRGTTRQRTTSTDSYGQHQHHHQQQQQQKLQHSHAYQISPGGTTTTRRTASLSMGSFATSSSSLNHNNSNNNSLLLPVAPPPPPVLLQGGGGGAASAAVLQQQQNQQQRHDEQEDEDDSLLHGLLLEPPPLTTCNISARTSSASSFLAGRTFLPPVNSIIQGGAGTGGPRSLINGIVAVAPQLPPPPPPVSTITTTTTSATATADGTRNSPCGMVVTENDDDDDDGNEREEEQGGTGHYDELDERVNIKPSSGGDCSSPSSFSSSPSSVAIAAVAAAAMPTSQPMTASAMKKAFTDFHNSQTTGHDGGSAYLHGGGRGDRDSSNRIFGSNGGSGGGSVANIEIAAAIGIHSDNSHHHHDSSFHKAEHLFWAAPPPTLTSVVSHGNLKQQAAGIVAAPSSFPSSASALCLESVPEHHRTDGRFDHHQQQHHRQSRILRPFNRVDSWQPGRRYLIAPAILAACPTAVWHSLGGGSSCSLSSNSGSTNDASSPFIHYRPDASPLSAQQAAVAIAENDSSNQGLFQRIVLGDCLISHGVLGAKGARSTQPSRIAAQWSSACLVLQQNYLLEFPQGTFGDKKSANASSTTTSATVAEGAATTALAAAEAASAATPSMMQHYQQQQAQPRGYAHLEFSQTFAQDDFCDALELQYYASPCAKKDLRVVLIRLSQKSAKERDGWKTCLNRAASLQMEDLYSILTRGEFEKQGGPEQQQQHYSKKGIDALSNHGHHDDKDEKVVLGKGQYSAVYPARRKDASQSIVALKVLEKNSFWKLVVKGREASVQATLSAKCSNLNSFLKLRGLFESSTHVVLELEYLQGTVDLFQYISSKGVLNESEAAQILSDILHSLSAMSQIGLAHRDVKPANVLMCNHSSKENTSDNCSNTKDSSSPLTRVKVCDFGMSTFVGVDGQVRGRCGTPGYVAPEIFSAGIHGGYGNQVDVFSAGVTLYVMLCGYEPFYGESDAELVENNRQAKVDFPPEEWGCVSQLAIDLVRRMMEPDPRLRPSAKEVLKHAWFQKHDATVHTPDQKKKVSNIQQQQHENDKIDDSSPDASACVIS
jgi:calcium/calmodulin-dependent protein kinase I